jgi:hypothetical protein
MVLVDSHTHPQNPKNWSTTRKYVVLLSALATTFLTAVNCTSVAIVTLHGMAWFGVDRERITLSLTLLLIPIAFTPMVLAPLSEKVRRLSRGKNGRSWGSMAEGSSTLLPLACKQPSRVRDRV